LFGFTESSASGSIDPCVSGLSVEFDGVCFSVAVDVSEYTSGVVAVDAEQVGHLLLDRPMPFDQTAMSRQERTGRHDPMTA
jgi:hypothetical protein